MSAKYTMMVLHPGVRDNSKSALASAHKHDATCAKSRVNCKSHFRPCAQTGFPAINCVAAGSCLSKRNCHVRSRTSMMYCSICWTTAMSTSVVDCNIVMGIRTQAQVSQVFKPGAQESEGFTDVKMDSGSSAAQKIRIYSTMDWAPSNFLILKTCRNPLSYMYTYGLEPSSIMLGSFAGIDVVSIGQTCTGWTAESPC